jgi:hypothetical protein
MNKLANLRTETQGVKFGKSVLDTIKENKEWSDIFSMDMGTSYIQEMAAEVTKDQITVAFNKENGRFGDVNLQYDLDWYRDTIKNEVVDFYSYVQNPLGRYYDSIQICLSKAFIVTDIAAYSKYLLDLDKKAKEETVAALDAKIAETTKNHEDMIRLGLKLYEVRELGKIRKVEKLRGTQVAASEVRELLEIS